MLPILQPLQVEFADRLRNKAVPMTEFRKDCEAQAEALFKTKSPNLPLARFARARRARRGGV